MRKPSRTRSATPSLARLLAASLTCTLMLPAARGLINPNYTPVDLVRQSVTILRLQIGPPDAEGDVAVAAVKPLKGQAPANLGLQADLRDTFFVQDFQAALGGRNKAPALLFSGDFSAAVAEDAAAGMEVPVGMLHVGRSWFALSRSAGRKLRIGPDPFELMTVWAGSDLMLEKAAEYIMADPRADVPTRVGVTWGADLKVADIAGPVHGCMALDPFGDGRPSLLVLADSGDRLFRPQDGGSKLVDVTASLGLETRSRFAAWADFNADGRTDLASCDGEKLTVHLMADFGTLEPGGPDLDLADGCVGLQAFDLPGLGRTALLVSNAADPFVVTAGRQGRLSMERLSSPAGAAYPQAGPCVVADFDADGLNDVVQPRSDAVWLYRGEATGRFAPGVPAGGVKPGEGLTVTFCGDYDADGLLDLMAAGEQGCSLLNNLGGTRFRDTLLEAGEVEYNSKPNVLGGASCDLNNDGRQEFMLLYARMPLQLYFNRGFRCFGYAVELELAQSDFEAAQAAIGGQQAGTIADFNGDGAQDVAVVTNDGRLWLLMRDAVSGPKLGVTVSPPRGKAGPVRVVGYDGKRCLGARSASAASPAFFGKRNKGPITLNWQGPGGQRTKQVLVLRPTRLELPGGEG